MYDLGAAKEAINTMISNGTVPELAIPDGVDAETLKKVTKLVTRKMNEAGMADKKYEGMRKFNIAFICQSYLEAKAAGNDSFDEMLDLE